MKNPVPLIKALQLSLLIPLLVSSCIFFFLAVYFAHQEAYSVTDSSVRSNLTSGAIVAGFPLVTKDYDQMSNVAKTHLQLPPGSQLEVLDLDGNSFYKIHGEEVEGHIRTFSKIMGLFFGDTKIIATSPVTLIRVDDGVSGNFSNVQRIGSGVHVGSVEVIGDLSFAFYSALVPRIWALAVLILCVLLSLQFVLNVGRKVSFWLNLLVEKGEELNRREYTNSSIKTKTSNIKEIRSLVSHHNFVVSEVKEYDVGMQAKVKMSTAEIQRQKDIMEITGAKLLSMNQSKSEFMRAISHDLRNPLASIKLGADMLMKIAENRNVATLSQHVMSSVVAIESIIDDIVDANLMEKDWVSINRTEADLVSLIDQVVNQYHQLAEQKQSDVFWMPSPDLTAIVLTDERIVGRIISSLLGNSLKNINSGCITLFAKTEMNESDQAQLAIEVTDNHYGFLGDNDKVFSEAEDCYADDNLPGGYGFDLSIVKQMVNALGGMINVVCKEGFGTSFIVRIPVDFVAQYSVTQNEIREHFSDLMLKIAIIDDSSPFAPSLSAFLLLHNIPTQIIKKMSVSRDSQELEEVDLIIGHKLSSLPALVSVLKERKIEVMSMESLQGGDYTDMLQKTMKIDHPVMIHTSFFSVVRLITSIQQNRTVTRIGHAPKLLDRAVVSPLGALLAAKSTGPLEGIKTLVVNDDNSFGSVLKALIESNSGECIIMRNPDELPGYPVLSSVDLAIVDQGFNGGSGIFTAKIIRDRAKGAPLKMICLTDNPVYEGSTSSFRMEKLFDLTLRKPLPSSDDFIDLVLRILR